MKETIRFAILVISGLLIGFSIGFYSIALLVAGLLCLGIGCLLTEDGVVGT